MKTRMNKMMRLASVLTVALAMTTSAREAEQKIDYPIDVCIVSGMKLGSMGEPYAHEHEGRTVYFCCAGCIGRFEANAEEMLKKYDREIIAQQKERYPLDVCVVSGEELGSHGAIIDVVHGDTLVRLCCQGCLSDFERDPDQFVEKVEEAQEGEAIEIPVSDDHDHDHDHHEHHHHH